MTTFFVRICWWLLYIFSLSPLCIQYLGFGTLSSGGAASPDLLDVEVKYQTNAQCNQDYNPRGLKITANMMCAADNGKDACQGGESCEHIFFYTTSAVV